MSLDARDDQRHVRVVVGWALRIGSAGYRCPRLVGRRRVAGAAAVGRRCPGHEAGRSRSRSALTNALMGSRISSAMRLAHSAEIAGSLAAACLPAARMRVCSSGFIGWPLISGNKKPGMSAGLRLSFSACAPCYASSNTAPHRLHSRAVVLPSHAECGYDRAWPSGETIVHRHGTTQLTLLAAANRPSAAVYRLGSPNPGPALAILHRGQPMRLRDRLFHRPAPVGLAAGRTAPPGAHGPRVCRWAMARQ